MKRKRTASLLTALATLLTLMCLFAGIPVSAEQPLSDSSVWDGTYPSAEPNAAYSGGSGTAADPYLLSSAADLAQLQANVNGNAGGGSYGYSNGKHFRLTCNVDIADQPWVGIGATAIVTRDQTYVATNLFRGTFDGDGHVVRNLALSQDESVIAQGLFAAAGFGATIRNLGILSGTLSVTGDCTFVGALLGFSVKNELTVVNCFNGADITVSSNYAATKEQYVGGLVGMISAFGTNCTLENCFNFGTIRCSQSKLCYKIGGLIGEYKSNGSGNAVLKNCSNIGAQISTEGTAGGNNLGSLVGYFEKTLIEIDNCAGGGSISTRPLNNKTAGVVGVLSACTLTVADSTYNCPITVTGDANVTGYEQIAIGKVWGTAQDTSGFTQVTEEIRLTNVALFAANAYQQGLNEASRLRLLSEFRTDYRAADEVGFAVTLTHNGTTREIRLSSHTVYTSILADGVPCTPSVGKTFIAYGITGMPVSESDNVTVTYSPYAILNGTVVYGQEAAITLQGGIRQ